MTTFTRAELRELAPGDLADLLKLADGDTPYQRGLTLGLDPTNPNDRTAIERAVTLAELDTQPFSPAVGAGQPGVKQDLTPPEPVPAGPDSDQDESPVTAYEALSAAGEMLPEADPQGAEDLAAVMAQSAASGRPFMAGTFALYADPSGAVVLVTEDKDGLVRRSVVPRKIVRLALSLMAGERAGMAGFLARKLGGRG